MVLTYGYKKLNMEHHAESKASNKIFTQFGSQENIRHSRMVEKPKTIKLPYFINQTVHIVTFISTKNDCNLIIRKCWPAKLIKYFINKRTRVLP